ncbi:MAG: VWA domain-containing protein [Acidobacteriota bacterium]|jgi:Ca-activated chloride channel family protein|nr:VWA domain-containing protein [Acidobacteriota bacterium]
MPFRFLRLYLPLTVLACLLIATVTHNGLSNQDPAKKPTQSASQLPERISDQTYRVSVDLVNVLCSAFDKNTNSFVTNLTQDDFTVFEDGQKQEIKNFARETNMPLTIAMLVDTSDSVAPKLKFEQEAAISFFQSILREKDRAMLVEFDSGVTLLQDFTSDPNKLAREIRKLKAAGGTALYDAIFMTCDEKMIRETGRKAIIILSDGDDESSNTTYQQALEMALRAEATIFAISVSKGGFFGVEESREGDTVLRNMARETGGRVFFPFKLSELDDNFRRINQELRSQFSIGYYSTNTARDGSFRKIEIKAAERGLQLRHRRGYYAPNN